MRRSISLSYFTILMAYLLLTTSACQPFVNSNGDDELTTDVSTVVVTQPAEISFLTLTPISIATLPPTPTPSPTKVPTQPILTFESSSTSEAKHSPTPTPTNTPSPTVLEGSLVFESRRGDTSGDSVIDLQDGIHLYKLNLVTNELIQLTTGDHFDMEPAWSPNGNQIAFVSNRGGNSDLYTINADGTNLRQLTNTVENEGAPAWSPDGTRIVYVVGSLLDSGLGKREIYVLSVDDQQTHAIETNELTNAFEPDWSPDGRFLVFTGQTEVIEDGATSYLYGIYLLDILTNTIHELIAPGNRVDEPKWLPRDDYFLSVLQSPGEFSSLSVRVFELQQNEESFLLHQVFVMEDVWGHYTWGTNGEWFISEIENHPHDTSAEAVFNSLDLAVVPVNFATQQPPLSSLGGSYDYSFIEESRLITDNTFYDGFPDWTP